MLPKIFFQGTFVSNVGTINNSYCSYYTAKRFADHEWSPEDYNHILELRTELKGQKKTPSMSNDSKIPQSARRQQQEDQQQQKNEEIDTSQKYSLEYGNYRYWNRAGDNSFFFPELKITGLQYQNGQRQSLLEPTCDPDQILGNKMNLPQHTMVAKMVDLDIDYQLTSAMYGLNLNIADKSNNKIFGGNWRPVGFVSLSIKNVAMPEKVLPDFNSVYASAHYKSILEDCFYSDAVSSSKILRNLQLSSYKNRLSARMMLYEYNKPSKMGKVMGYLEPYCEGMPENISSTRFIRNDNGLLFFRVIQDTNQKYHLEVDLSNLFGTQGYKYEQSFLDFEYVKVSTLDGTIERELHFDKTILTHYSSVILQCLTKEEHDQFKSKQLVFKLKYKQLCGLAFRKDFDKEITFTEELYNISADLNQFRINPLEQQKTTFRINKLGQPNDDCQVQYQFTDSQAYDANIPREGDPNNIWPKKDFKDWPSLINNVRNSQQPDHEPSTYKKLEPYFELRDKKYFWKYYENSLSQELNKYSSEIKANKIGTGIYELPFPKDIIKGEIGKEQEQINPRSKFFGLDSYCIMMNYKTSLDTNYFAEPISLLYFQKRDEKSIKNPDWLRDIGPLMRHFALLYPVMQTMINFYYFDQIVKYLPAFQRVFSYNYNDPRYMPVTREISSETHKMIQNWLENPIFDKKNIVRTSKDFQHHPDIICLKKDLQDAIVLEHSTIPVYLSALYSIKIGKLPHIQKLLQQIIVQEMVHMAIGANLLNAIGGSPKIAFKDKVPPFHLGPQPLPGGVLKGLHASIGPLTRERCFKVFMQIESPKEEIKEIQVLNGQPFEFQLTKYKNTIGEFYNKIKKTFMNEQFKKEFEELFKANYKKQLVYSEMPEIIPVLNLTSAIDAIEYIQKDGEGASIANYEGGFGNERNHFLTFLELASGRPVEEVVPQTDRDGKIRSYIIKLGAEHQDLIINPASVNTNPIDTEKELEKNINKVDEKDKTKEDEKQQQYNNLYMKESFNQQYAAILSCLQQAFDLTVQEEKQNSLKQAITHMRAMQLAYQRMMNPSNFGSPKSQASVQPDFNIENYLPNSPPDVEADNHEHETDKNK